MRILILGGDGYLGWPTAMHLSNQGHEVAVADNYMRRKAMREEGVDPICETPLLDERIRYWNEKSGNNVFLFVGDLNHWDFISRVFLEFRPEAVVHYAEQPSAPYSMLRRETAMRTISNNLGVTANVIFAVREYCPNAHIVKLGTMGEYGTPNIDIEEGWIEIEHNGRKAKCLFPRQGGSLYHTTKIMDTDLLWFYVRTWGLRVTDLMQGPVYGLFTDELENDDALISFFSYDELFGTVINRFIAQAVADYPLTIYGKGGQTRGYLNIKDTLSCVRLALEHPASKGELRVLNQFTEVFSVNELAGKVQSVGTQLGMDIQVKNMENPRIELEEHYYNPKHTGLLELGLKPTFLTDDVLARMMEYVARHKVGISRQKIFRGAKWA